MRTGGGKPSKGTAEAKTDEENRLDIAEKVQYLFDHYSKADGERYTPATIERASRGRLKYKWVWQLTRAEIWRPSINDLVELTKIFGCEPEIWVTSLEVWKKQEQATDEQNIQDGETLQNIIAIRSKRLNGQGQKLVLDMIKSLEQSGFIRL